MTFRWHDGTQTAPAHALLHLTEYGKGNSLEMAYATTRVGGAGDGSSHDDTIAYATIDNAKYGYWALFHLPPAADARAYNIVLEYIPPTATTGRLSIPAAAFVPFSDNYQYENLGRRLTYLGGPARAHFEAPVHLPQGAQVTKVTFHFNDDSTAANGYARLCRTDLAGNYLDMAYIDSYYAWGYAGRSDTSIESPVVDNSQYAYWVYWDLPISTGTGNNVWGCGVVIEYDAPVATMSRGYIAIPAAAFTPFADDHHYENHGRYLIHRSGEAGAHYEAPVPLPQGATVTKVSFYYKHDEETWVTGHGRLCRTDLVGNYSDMAYIPTMQSFGFGSGHDYDIVSPGVDNARYVYWAYMDLPSSTGTDGAWGSGMIIEYEYAMCYLPMILSGQ
jgi:hypothetical protein